MRRLQVLALAACSLAAVLLHGADAALARSDDARAIFDRQPQLLQKALGEVQPTDASRPHTYFVGFAGYGGQAVFKREVLAVRQLFDSRFGTKGRSTVLINHRSTLRDVPLASAANLETVLEHVGRQMDTGRDTLFLFLSSHGDEGLLAVEMPGLGLSPLTPDQLKRMLDGSGIRNRVVVVSACHSGSFIPALADATTLVIAAARSDRSSFGCEDRRPWTYFGDAYFNRALRQETSYRRAFDVASDLIDDWETKDRLMPSLPQIAGGEALPERD